MLGYVGYLDNLWVDLGKNLSRVGIGAQTGGCKFSNLQP